MSFVNVNGGSVVAPSFIAYLAYTIATSQQIQLNWPSQFVDNPNNVASIMDITAGAAGAPPCALILPDATAVSPGQSTLIVNVGANPFQVLLFGTLTNLVTIAAGQSYYIYLTDNTTAAGTWHITTIPGAPVVTSVGAVTVGATAIANMLISNSPITSAGNLGFAFQGDLNAILGLATTGFAVRTGAATWALRTINGTAGQITVTNGTGVGGNVTIGLANNIVVNTLVAGDISIGVNPPGANVITSINANENIVFLPNGTGDVHIGMTTPAPEPRSLVMDAGGQIYFYSNTAPYTNFFSLEAGNRTTDANFVWPTTVPLAGQVMAYLGGTALGWTSVTTSPAVTTPNGIARYLNNTGTLADSSILIDNLFNITNARSIRINNIADTSGLLLGGQLTPTRIATIANNLILAPNGASFVQSLGHIGIDGNNGAPGTLFLNNIGNTFFTALTAHDATAANTTFSVPSVDAAANSLMMTDGLANWKFTTTPSGTTANAAGVAKAWAVFDGATTTLKANYNVATITRSGVAGGYIATFTTALSSANYAVSIASNGVNTNVPFTAYYTTKTTAALTFFLWDTTGAALADTTDVSVMCTVQ